MNAAQYTHISNINDLAHMITGKILPVRDIEGLSNNPALAYRWEDAIFIMEMLLWLNEVYYNSSYTSKQTFYIEPGEFYLPVYQGDYRDTLLQNITELTLKHNTSIPSIVSSTRGTEYPSATHRDSDWALRDAHPEYFITPEESGADLMREWYNYYSKGLPLYSIDKTLLRRTYRFLKHLGVMRLRNYDVTYEGTYTRNKGDGSTPEVSSFSRLPMYQLYYSKWDTTSKTTYDEAYVSGCNCTIKLNRPMKWVKVAVQEYIWTHTHQATWPSASSPFKYLQQWRIVDCVKVGTDGKTWRLNLPHNDVTSLRSLVADCEGGSNITKMYANSSFNFGLTTKPYGYSGVYLADVNMTLREVYGEIDWPCDLSGLNWSGNPS